MMPRQADHFLLGDELSPLFEIPEGHAEDLLPDPIAHSERRPELLPGKSLLQGKPFMVILKLPDDPCLQVGINRPGKDPRLFPVDEDGLLRGKHPLQDACGVRPGGCPSEPQGGIP